MAGKVLGAVHLQLCIYFVWFSASVFYFTFKKKVLKINFNGVELLLTAIHNI